MAHLHTRDPNMPDQRPFDYDKALAGMQRGIQFHEERIAALRQDMERLLKRRRREQEIAASRGRVEHGLDQPDLQIQCGEKRPHGAHAFIGVHPVTKTMDGPYWCRGVAS